ncbi:MAG: hypothetical protein CMO55_04255 [Verrucomicrobiales bacterium]|nr:hypothetical protein [Verrucomicrobiales bacterium]
MSFAASSVVTRTIFILELSENSRPSTDTGWSLQQRYDEAQRSRIQMPTPRRHIRKPQPSDRIIVPMQAPEDAPPSNYKDSGK